MVSDGDNVPARLKSKLTETCKRYSKCWSITVVLICCGMSYQLYSLINNYLKYDYDEVTISDDNRPVFPDVTVCNMDAVYGGRGNVKELAEFTGSISKWDDTNKRASANGYVEITYEKMLTRPALLSNLPLQATIHRGYSFSDIIVSCTYGSSDKRCSESDAILYIHPVMYNCYTLKLNLHELHKSGPEHGLSLILYIGDQTDTITRDKVFSNDSRVSGTKGWRVVIHERDTVPPFDEKFDIMPGISTSIAVSTTTISRLPDPYSGCVDEVSVPKTSYVGTKYTCEETILANIIENNCGCVSVNLVYNHTDLFGRYCLFYNESDQLQTFQKYDCELRVRKEMYEHQERQTKDKCKWRCQETNYDLQTSLSVFPTREAMAWFFTNYLINNPNRDSLIAWDYFLNYLKDPNKTVDDYKFVHSENKSASVIPNEVAQWIKNSFARVNIYFKSMTIETKIQKPSYTVTQLIADVGGIVGIWVGLSVLAIVEFLTKIRGFFGHPGKDVDSTNE